MLTAVAAWVTLLVSARISRNLYAFLIVRGVWLDGIKLLGNDGGVNGEGDLYENIEEILCELLGVITVGDALLDGVKKALLIVNFKSWLKVMNKRHTTNVYEITYNVCVEK
jgi:uncharacterized membrane protein